MKKIPTRYVLAFLSALSLGAGSAWAQAALPDKAASEKSKDDASLEASNDQVYQMDPFTVTTEHEGYKADDTLAGGRVRTTLKDTPASLSVVTAKLMRDLGITKAEELFVYTPNTEVAGLNGNFSGMAARGQGIPSGAAEGTRLTNPGGVNRARGLTAMDSTRNYFPSDIPWDGFNISRVDISRGPNSFLFGTGSPSGIANVSTNEAVFKDRGSIETHVGSFGSTRESLDYNKVLLDQQLAVRLDLVNDNRKYQQDPAFNHTKRAYGAVRFDPKLFDTDSSHTKIQASFEHGQVISNNPRMIPPRDYITGYLNDPTASKTGYNPWEYAMNTSISSDPSKSLWASSGSLSNQWMWGNGAQFFWDATTGNLLNAGTSSFASPTGNGFGAMSNTWNVHSQGYSGYARSMNYLYRQSHNNQDGGPFAGSYRGTVRYFDQTLSDPSVFDFYHKLIDGDNKREWQRWNAYNVNIVQSLFNDRLVIQGVADHQEYLNGNSGILSSPLLVMDLNSYNLKTPTWLPGATTNPNVGRPAVFGDQGSYNIHNYTRDNYQGTAAYSLDFEKDFAPKGFWAKLLGRHELTGLVGRYQREEEHRNYRLNGIDTSYQILSGASVNPRPIDNGFSWLAYLGGNLLGKPASGADLANLQYHIAPPSTYNYSGFYSKEWTAGSSVSPSAPWVHAGPNGSTLTQTQADNPANYRGYFSAYVPTINGASHPDVLATGGNKKIQRVTSNAFLYQGHLWDNMIIPTFGYRRDTTFQRGNDVSQHQDPVTKVYNLDYQVTDTGIKATTTSKSYGVAVHLPKVLKSKLPEGTDLTFYYFHGANETPKVRYAIDGSQMPNESGKTDDFSMQFDGLNGRLTARLTYFKTQNNNAQASVGQPLGTFMIRALPEWTLILHAYSMAHAALPRDSNGYFILPSSNWDSWTRESWSDWPYGWMAQHPVEAAKANQDMMTKFTELYPQSYWDAYGYNIDVAAIKRGDWSHIVKGTDYPYFSSYVGGGDTIHGEYPIIDQNLESKGLELEVTFRPTKNWDITLNASKVDATQTGLGAAAQKQLQGMADLFLGSGVQYAGIWGGYEGAKNSFLGDLWAPYLTQIALIGSEQPEQRKYRFNGISSYRIDHGWAKGLDFGGAYRWEDKAILGYGIHETTIYGEKSYIADVSKPIYGPTDDHFDAWIGYQRKLTNKITWRVQLNVRNVGESNHLVPVAVQPDGSVAQSRIAEGSTYDLSMRLSF